MQREPTNTYRLITIDGLMYKSHRIAWLLHYGVWPDEHIDHIDGNGLNNRIENLRDVTKQENAKNSRMKRSNSSGVTGVCLHKPSGKWRARIRVGGKQTHLGLFTDIDEAASVYRKTADALGFTARHGETV